MDSRTCIRLSRRYLLLILTGLLLGCQDPDREIEFRDGSKHREELRLNILDDAMEIKLFGHSSMPVCCNQYTLGLEISLLMRNPNKHMIVQPDSLRIEFGDTQMTNTRSRCDTTMSTRRVKYDYYFRFTCDPARTLYKLDQTDGLNSDFIKIYIGKMFWFEGRNIEIDTVYAREPKVKRFRDEIQRYLRR